jgi:uncharacterized phage protein (TIGR01671 family)
MRDIEFRGKDEKNGKWVFGHGFVIDNGTAGFPVAVYSDERFNWYRVIPETAGQYTDLKDKNGIKIFEGDIVKYNDGDVYEIVYSTNIHGNSAYIGSYMLKDKKGHTQLICWAMRPYQFAEVIGNIHDNPELLEEKE